MVLSISKKNLRIAWFFALLPFLTYPCNKRLKSSTHCIQLWRKIAKIISTACLFCNPCAPTELHRKSAKTVFSHLNLYVNDTKRKFTSKIKGPSRILNGLWLLMTALYGTYKKNRLWDSHLNSAWRRNRRTSLDSEDNWLPIAGCFEARGQAIGRKRGNKNLHSLTASKQ